MKATTPRPPVTSTGPRYGIELKSPASSPQMMYCCDAEPPQRDPVATATTTLVKTCTRMKLAICG